jgi:hypothetical protein
VDDTVPSILREVAVEAEAAAVTDGAASNSIGGGRSWSGAMAVALPGGGAETASDAARAAYVLDRTAFARLVRTAQQDRLELFESRRARRDAAMAAAAAAAVAEVDAERSDAESVVVGASTPCAVSASEAIAPSGDSSCAA